jgi:hypothetical protein
LRNDTPVSAIIKARAKYIVDSYREGSPSKPTHLHITPVLAKRIRDDVEGITDRLLGMSIAEDASVETFELR